MIIFSVGLVVLLRLYCLRIALENEEKTVLTGGIEDNIHNVKWRLVAHMVFYFSCLCEALIK